MTTGLSRRGFLSKGAALIGCSAAAHPLMTTVTLASAPWDARLVVIILRGAMDGLDAVQPYGDPNLAGYRPTLPIGPGQGALDLDGYFALHPGFAGLHPLWAKGELSFVHAVSTPYRDKRSHFDGQDILEAGTGSVGPDGRVKDGWLNRLLQEVPGAEAKTAFAIGRDQLQVLHGAADVLNWAPSSRLDLSPQARLLLEQVYHDDPVFQQAALEAMDLAEDLEATTEGDTQADMQMMQRTARRGERVDALARFAAERLREDTRIAAFSLSGWDTHRIQAKTMGNAGERLATAITTLKSELGPVWNKTAVVAMTEFGRTVAENGSGGTDHGTGGTMVLAGGALSGARVHGQWPGLAEADLFNRRDLMPTGDVRAYAAWAMRGLFGIDRARLEGTVFPGLDMGSNLGLIA